MQLAKLKNIDFIQFVTANLDINQEYKGLYSCDLLSWVLGHIHEDDYVLLTVLNTINLVAVSSVINLKAIIFCDNVVPTADIIEKAKEDNLLLFTSSKSSIETSKAIFKNESLL